MRLWTFGLAFASTLLASRAMAAPEFVPLQGTAQGQSLTGASQLNDSLYTNPAASAFTQVYAIDGIFHMPKSFAVSILDTQTSGVGGALGYFRKTVGDHKELLQGVKFLMGGKVSDYIGFGASGKALWGPNLRGEYTKMNDLDVGILGAFSFLQLGLTLRNTLGGNESMDMPREWSIGARVGWEDTLYFSVSTSSRWDRFRPYQYGAGAEYVSPYFFSIKGGYRLQPDQKISYWSGGASFLSPKFSLHYAAEFPQAPNAKVEHLVGTTLLF